MMLPYELNDERIATRHNTVGGGATGDAMKNNSWY